VKDSEGYLFSAIFFGVFILGLMFIPSYVPYILGPLLGFAAYHAFFGSQKKPSEHE